MVANEQVADTPKTESKQIVVVKEVNNQTLWNVVIIAITIGILLWPYGLLDISLLERATVDCSEFDFGEYGNMEDDCKEWRFEGRTYLFFTLVISMFALTLNYKPKSQGTIGPTQGTREPTPKRNRVLRGYLKQQPTGKKPSLGSSDEIRCPSCKKRLSVPYDRRPITVKCPQCDAKFMAKKEEV